METTEQWLTKILGTVCGTVEWNPSHWCESEQHLEDAQRLLQELKKRGWNGPE